MMNNIKFSCRVCNQHLSIEADAAGMEINCPTCGIAQQVPLTVAVLPLEGPAAQETAFDPPPAAVIGPDNSHYWAFISYSSKDQVWARWLHRAIETYGFPIDLIEHHHTPTGHPAPKRFHPVFRDRDELPASADLGAVIKKALSDSRYLIVICSPNAAQSQWVNKEIETFLTLGRRPHILAIIVDGEPNAGDSRECFPPALREFEPIAADARPQGDGKTNAKLKLLAGMLGVNFDSLKRRDALRRRRWLVRIAAVTGSLIAMAATLIGVAVYQGHLAEQRKEAAEIAVQKVEAARQKADAAGQIAGEAAEKATEATQIVWDEKAKGLWGLYAADMVKIQNAWDQLDMPRVVELLEGQRPERTGGVDLRGFEWYYWWNQSHGISAESAPIRPYGDKIAISPDGKCLAQSSSYRGDNVKILDLTSGKELLIIRLNKDSADVTSICYSPDGKLLATAGSDHAVRVWDVASGRERLVLKGHKTSVKCICFSPDGSRIASASMDEAKVWDVTKGRELLALKVERNQSYIEVVCFSPDGKRIATGGDRELKLWDAASGKELLKFDGGAQSICFSPDCKRMVAAGREMGAGTVFDIKNGQKLFTLKGTVGSVCYSPNGTRIANGSHLWEAASGQELLALKGGGKTIRFSPDGKRLISAGDGKMVQIWDAAISAASAETVNPAANASAWDKTTGAADSAAALRFSPDGKRLASISTARKSDGEYVKAALKIWDTENGKELITLEGHDDDLYSVRFSPDGRRIATVGEDNGKDMVKVWDVASGRQLLAIKEMNQEDVGVNGRCINSDILCFSPDGIRLAVACEDDTVKIWDVTDAQKRITLKGRTTSVICVYFSPDGKWLAVVDDDAVKVWDAATGRESFSLKGGDDGFTSVCFSPDGRRMATGCWDGLVRLWDASSGKKLATLKGITEDAYIYGVCFSPDGTRVAACSDEDKKGLVQVMTVWDASSGRKLLSVKGGAGVSVHFSPDGKRLVSGMTVWDAASGKELFSLQAEDGIVSFNFDGKRRASRTEARDEKSIQKLLAFKGVSIVCLSPDGQRLAGLSGKRLMVWDAEDVAAGK